MPLVSYPASSPYAETPQSNFFIGRYVHRPIPARATDVQITVQTRHQNRPDRLSQDLYGTPAYWWIFMLRNMDLIRDPIWDLNAGMQIYVPSAETVRRTIG